jgi:hypothetical protein
MGLNYVSRRRFANCCFAIWGAGLPGGMAMGMSGTAGALAHSPYGWIVLVVLVLLTAVWYFRRKR